VITAVLPDVVAAADAFRDIREIAPYPEEREATARSVERRRLEHATVRTLARAALGRLGLPPGPIVSDRRGVPRWPDGIVGSMTHCDGYRAAVVARSAELAAVGIDAEPNLPLRPATLETVSVPEERRWISSLSVARPGVCWDRLLFSAKESVFKAWFPSTRYELDFDAVVVGVESDALSGPDDLSTTLNSTAGQGLSGRFTFDMRLPPGAPEGDWLLRGEGRWAVGSGIVVTGLAVPAPDCPGDPDAR
jgi:4'-phosphopantetheinyl transferase EntD